MHRAGLARSWPLVAVVALAAGCYASHERGDASAPVDASRDAGTPPDGAAPDAPLPDAPAVTLTITLGEDPLADLAPPLRTSPSHDYAYLRLRGRDAPVEVDLNEGAQWDAWSMHDRAIPLPPGAAASDVLVVGIRHEAAGPEIATDNWTMAAITVGTSAGDTLWRGVGTPLFTFRRGGVWEHVLAP